MKLHTLTMSMLLALSAAGIALGEDDLRDAHRRAVRRGPERRGGASGILVSEGNAALSRELLAAIGGRPIRIRPHSRSTTGELGAVSELLR